MTRRNKLLLLATAAIWILLGLGCWQLARADSLRVVDGDTIYFPDRKVRLWGVDAPERNHPCGREAKVWLQRFLAGKKLRCLKRDTDRYGRSVELCTVPGPLDVAQELVRAGWARDWPKYSDGYYGAAEAAARRQGAGMWAEGACR